MRVVVSQFEGIDATPALPLAAGNLIAAARADATLGAALDFSIEFRRRNLADVVADYNEPDVLGFSLYPWNAAYSLAVAQAAKDAYPRCLIVVGGPSVPRGPARAEKLFEGNPAIDVAVFSEGELAFRELLRARLTGDCLDSIGSIAYRNGADVAFTSSPSRITSFAELASPFLDGTFDALCAEHRDRFSMALLETNRGCPFSCTFCDWSLTKQVVEFPIARVRVELDWVARNGFHHIMLADANFGIRRRDLDIAHHVAELRKKTGAPTSFYFYLTKNDHARNLATIDVLQEADIGCWVGLAVQDFDDEVLDAVKRDNIQTGESMKLRDICGDRNIPTFNELILGLPGQTYASFTETVATAMPGSPRHDFVLFLCRMIDNTELSDPQTRARYAIETRVCEWKTQAADWDPVVNEFQEVVVATNSMPLADWKRAFRFSFFAATLYNLRLLRVVLRHIAFEGIDLRDYLEHLTEQLAHAPASSMYGELGAILETHIETLLDGGSFVLSHDDGAPLYVDEALAKVALRDYDRFLSETAALTEMFLGEADPNAMGEAFRYQSLVTTRRGETEPRSVTLEHDWPSYIAGGASLEARATTVRFVPPSYAGLASYDAFFATHLGCVRVRLDAGVIEAYRPKQLRVVS